MPSGGVHPINAPFSDLPPADAMRASMSRFQRGLRGDVPYEWLAFADETDALRQAHEARFAFTDKGKHGFQVESSHAAFWYVDTAKVRNDMRQRGQEDWNVRFADFMDLGAISSATRPPAPMGDGATRSVAGIGGTWAAVSTDAFWASGAGMRGVARQPSRPGTTRAARSWPTLRTRSGTLSTSLRQLRSTSEATGTSSWRQPCLRMPRLAGAWFKSGSHAKPG